MTRFQKIIFWFLFILILSALIYIQYYSLVHFKYPVPPGDDPASHYQMAMKFYTGESSILDSWKSGGYPPGYHLAMAKAARLFHTDLLAVILWTYPAILIIAGLAIFATSYGLFGPWAGLFAFVIYSFATRSTIQLLNDGGYPNILAAHAFLPLFFLFLIKFLQKKRFIYLLLGLVFAGLIIFTHHATTLVLIGMILVMMPVLIVSFALRRKWSWQKCFRLLFGSLIIFTLLLAALMKSDLFAPAKALLGSTMGLTSTFPYINFSSQIGEIATWEIINYPRQIGPVITYLGLVGLIGLWAIITVKKQKEYYISIIILSVWAVLLFLGSRMSFLSNPERMGRDLAVPISVLAAGFIVVFINQFRTYGMKVFLVFATIIFIFWSIPQRVSEAMVYQPMVRVTPADLEAIEFLKSQPAGKLLVRDYNYYLPVLLPDWQLEYFPTDALGATTIKQFSYAYIVTRRGGWAPDGYNEGWLKNYFSDEVLDDYYTFSSTTKEIYLVKIRGH